jgi:hypothetical protein
MITSTFEKHSQTIIGGLILAAILGMATMMFDMRDRMTRAEEKAAGQYQLLIAVKEQLNQSTADRYTGTDARKEFAEVYRRLNTIEAYMEARREKK